jgi:hypothetical protein
MSVRSLARSSLDSSSLDSASLDRASLGHVSFPLPASPRTAAAAHATRADAAELDAAELEAAYLDRLDNEEQWPADEIPTSVGCLRGFCWAIGIESTVALCVYGAWRIWSLLR